MTDAERAKIAAGMTHMRLKAVSIKDDAVAKAEFEDCINTTLRREWIDATLNVQQ